MPESLWDGIEFRKGAYLPYFPTPDTDVILANWWVRLRADGDLARMFIKRSQSLSAFYNMMGAPTVLCYKLNDAIGVWAAAWFTPCLSGSFLGMYLAPGYRASLEGFKAVLEAHHFGFQHNDSLLAVTKQPKILDESRKIGYDVLGQVPHLWDGEDAWLLMLTRETWWRQTLPRYGRLIGVTHAAKAAEEVLAHGLVVSR